MLFVWTARYFAYFGLQFNVEELGKALVLNFTIMGLAEIVASLASAPIKRLYGRRRSMQLSLLVCSGACFLSRVLTFPVLVAVSRLG
jgi:MFS family permease